MTLKYMGHTFSAEPTTCNINQGMHNALAVPTINLSKHNINQCVAKYITKQQHQVPYGTLFKDILQRIILPA